jgi:hypothetical protein
MNSRAERRAVFSLAALLAGLGAALLAVLPSGGCHATSEEKAAQLGREFRISNLPKRLQTDMLKLDNDRLANDIAELEGRPKDLTKIAVDKIVVKGDETSIHIAEEVWLFLSRPRNPATSDLRAKFFDLDTRLDEISERCNAGARAAKTVDEAQIACADLNAASEAMSKMISPPGGLGTKR